VRVPLTKAVSLLFCVSGQTAAKRAGVVGKVSPHWMRHVHASHALDRGAPIHLVSHTLGHSSVATTGRYLHVRPTESSSKYLAV
jgi:integrase/recombinase XerD